jgi:hypothetical protein
MTLITISYLYLVVATRSASNTCPIKYSFLTNSLLKNSKAENITQFYCIGLLIIHAFPQLS